MIRRRPCPVPGKYGLSTFIPVNIIHGAKEGKVLALVAGTPPVNKGEPLYEVERIKR